LEPSTIIGLVAAGVGVAIVPDGIQCIRLEGAIYKNLTDISAYSGLYLARRRDDPNTHLRDLRNAGDDWRTETATEKTHDYASAKIVPGVPLRGLLTRLIQSPMKKGDSSVWRRGNINK
jgi:hypothetical protein